MVFGTSEINLSLALGLCALQPFVSPLRKSQLPLTLIGSCFCYEKFRQFLDCSIKQQNNNKNSLIKKKILYRILFRILNSSNLIALQSIFRVLSDPEVLHLPWHLNDNYLNNIPMTRSQNCTHQYFWDREPSFYLKKFSFLPCYLKIVCCAHNSKLSNIFSLNFVCIILLNTDIDFFFFSEIY